MTDPLEFFPREHPYRKMREAAAAPAPAAPAAAVPDSELHHHDPAPRLEQGTVVTDGLRDWSAPGYDPADHDSHGARYSDVPRGTPFVISDIPAIDGGSYTVTVTCNKPMTRGGMRNALEFALRWFIGSDYFEEIAGS
jgi:hypothetical protein